MRDRRQPSLFGGDAPSAESLDVRGFTFWRTWAEAVAWDVPAGATAPCRKDVDNRPPRSQLASRVGRHIAIHTGRTVDKRGLAWLNERFGYRWSEADLAPPGVILGVARVLGVAADLSSPWHFGETYQGKPNVGWSLGDVVVFDPPVTGPGGAPINGALGCWRLDGDVLRDVTDRFLSKKGGSP